MKDRILDALVKAPTPLRALDVARLLGTTTKKQVNKYLYELENIGKVRKSSETPPRWTHITRTDTDDSVSDMSSSSTAQKSAKYVLIEHSTRISELPYGFFEAASLLSIGTTPGTSWEKFAGELGFSLEDIALFRGQTNPVKEVITNWQTQKSATFENFVAIMKKMNRQDVLCKLTETLGDQMSSDVKELLKDTKSEDRASEEEKPEN